MKSKSSTIKTLILRSLLIITFITVGSSAFTSCNAQSPVEGKWKEVSTKLFLNTGGAAQEHPISGTMEFKSDHTYIVTDGLGKDDRSTGEWSVSGNQLTMKAAAQLRKGEGAQVYTFSITGNTMVRTMMAKPPYNKVLYKTEDTSIRQ